MQHCQKPPCKLAPLQVIQSSKDPIIRTLCVLDTARGRAEKGLYLIEGAEMISRALKHSSVVQSLVLSDAIAEGEEGCHLRALAQKLPVYKATAGLLAKAVKAKPYPQCLAVASGTPTPLSALTLARGVLLMIDDMENIDNLGMVLRSAEAAGIDGVVLTGKTVAPYHRRTVRASRGAVFTIPICQEPDTLKALHELRERGVTLVATSANEGTLYHELSYERPTVVIIGNEHVGLSQRVIQAADQTARIPMAGFINSLNVSVAGSIMLYEALRTKAMFAPTL